MMEPKIESFFCHKNPGEKNSFENRCRACFMSLHKINCANKSVIHFYNELVDASITNLILCMNCDIMLKKFDTFKQMCMRTNNVVTTFEVSNKQITIEEIQFIQEKQYYNFTQKNFTLNCCKSQLCQQSSNLEFIDTSDKSYYSDTNDDDIIQKVESEIKNEVVNVGTQKTVSYPESTSPYSNTSSIETPQSSPKRKKVAKRKISKTEDPLSDNVLKNNEFNDYFVKERFLSVKEQRENFEKRQVKQSYLQAKFKCGVCYKGIQTEYAYNSHMKRHEYKSNFQCEFCKMCFTSQQRIYTHMLLHTTRYHCKLCSFTSSYRTLSTMHIRWHQGVQYLCAICGKKFSTVKQFTVHKRLHSKKDECVCQLCGYSFDTKNGVEMHKKLRHLTDETSIPSDGPLCEDCNIRFLNEDALNFHKAKSPKHGNVKNLSLQTYHSRKKRMKDEKDDVGSDEKKQQIVMCELCGHPSLSSAAYKQHYKKVHTKVAKSDVDENVLCQICGKTFKNKNLLKFHKHYAHTSRPYTCEVCNKVLKNKLTYKAHMNLHTGTQFPCPGCGKTFNQKSNRDRHVKQVHANLRENPCTLCDKSFKSKNSLNLHITHVHQKKPYKKRIRNKDKALDTKVG